MGTAEDLRAALDEAARLRAEVERLRASDEAVGAIHRVCADAGIAPGHVLDRLRLLLKDTYYEGWRDGEASGNSASSGNGHHAIGQGWDASDARKALEAGR